MFTHALTRGEKPMSPSMNTKQEAQVMTRAVPEMMAVVTLAAVGVVVAGFLGFTQPGARFLTAVRSAYYYGQGDALAAKGDNDSAVADYDEAIRLDPENVATYNKRSHANKAKGDNDRAITDYGE